MTLQNIRDQYGVPAEVGMRVSYNRVHFGRIIAVSSFDPSSLVIGWDLYSQGLAPITRLTYYNDDGDVIWRPE